MLNLAINSTILFVRSKSSKPQEPDYIASLIVNFTPTLFDTLKFVFPKIKFNVTGVFIHQKPLANIGKTKNPEIGDILFVYIHTDVNGNKRYNSLLLQAKIAKSRSVTISSTDEHQLELYSFWPKFHYVRAGKTLNGKERNVTPKSINDGAQYLVISETKTPIIDIYNSNIFSCAVPAKTLEVDNTLVSELIDLLKFKSGRTFDDSTIVSDDWSKMIWDLLKITLYKASKRSNIGLKGFQRQSANDHDGYVFFAREADSIFDDLFTDITESDLIDSNTVDDNEGGLSLVLIEASEQTG